MNYYAIISQHIINLKQLCFSIIYGKKRNYYLLINNYAPPHLLIENKTLK